MNHALRTTHFPAFVALLVATASLAHGGVRLERVPESGVQPQTATSADGAVHLVYLKGDPKSCDVRYVRRTNATGEWSVPVTVNDESGSAIAIGTIRGAQIAIGKNNSVHVAWNGPARKTAGGMASSLFYSRLEINKKAFEPQRDLLSGTKNLDGGASIAANTSGGVFIVWHAAAPNAEAGELNRKVFVLRSADNGASFAPLKAANEDFSGVCACCSLKAFTTSSGELLTLYRAARSITQRDITLLSSPDVGETFSHETLHPWAIGACPMSSAALVSVGREIRAAWETDGKIFSSTLGITFAPREVSEGKARHPSLAVNSLGDTLVTWSVGTGWQKGGALAWCVLDAAGQPTPEKGKANEVPVWSHTAAYSTPENDFVILH